MTTSHCARTASNVLDRASPVARAVPAALFETPDIISSPHETRPQRGIMSRRGVAHNKRKSLGQKGMNPYTVASLDPQPEAVVSAGRIRQR